MALSELAVQDHWEKLGNNSRRRWTRIKSLRVGSYERGKAGFYKDLATITHTDFASVQEEGGLAIDVFSFKLFEAVKNFYRFQRRNLTLTALEKSVYNPQGQEVAINCSVGVELPVRTGSGVIGGMDLVDIIARKYPLDIASSCIFAMMEGVNLGADDSLQMIARPRTPMAAVTREYFVGRGEILPNSNMGAVVTRPTKFRGVILHSQYAPNNNLPLMFFKVNRLSRW